MTEPWQYYGAELAKAIEEADVPDDLKQLFTRYLEMYNMANDVHGAIKKTWFQGTGGVTLRFDTDGDVVGELPIDVVLKMWSEKAIFAIDDEDPAIRYTAEYRGPGALAIKGSIVKSEEVLDGLLKPLRDVGWVASVTKTGEEYHVEATLTYGALMRDAEVS